MKRRKFYLVLVALFFVLAIVHFVVFMINGDRADFACSLVCIVMALVNMQSYQIDMLEQEVDDLKYRHNVVLVDMRKDR